jgi:hypothetical protein
MRPKGGALALSAALLAACATTTPAPAAGDRTQKPALAAPAAIAPTAAATPARGPALVNPGFESTVPGRRGDPEGWFTFQHAGDKSYHFALDTSEPHGGARSLRIENVGPEPYGAIAQALDAKAYGGKVARLSAWMRTRDVSETGAVLTLVTLQSGALLAQNFMAEAPVKGTTDWKRYAITLPVTKGAERIEVGAMLQGKGILWLDDVEIDFVDP